MAGAKKKVLKKKLRPKVDDDQDEIVIKVGQSSEKSRPKQRESEDKIILAEPSDDDLDLDELEDEETDDEDDDVVVISIGPPPKEKAEIIEEVPRVISHEPEEEGLVVAEVVGEKEPEEKEPEEKDHTEEKPGDEEPKRGRQLAVVIIVIIVIVASISAYVFFAQNQNPVADLSLNPNTPVAGEIIDMDGSGSTDDKEIIRYEWDFGDETSYTEESGNAKDGRFEGRTTHSYEESDDYTITFTVWDSDGKKGVTTTDVTVSELEVTVPNEMIGDSIRYNVNGEVNVDNSDGLATVPTPLGPVTLKGVEITYEGFMDSSIEGTDSQKDGFGVFHDTLKKYNEQDLDLDGNVSGSITLTGTSSETPFTYKIDQGTLLVNDMAFIDLTTNKTIFSYTHSDLSISVDEDLNINSIDDVRTYSNLRTEPAVLRVEDLSSDRSFTIGQKQTKIIGDIAYSWEVEKAANIEGYPSLGINIDIDDGTKERMGITDFEMWMWIANEISYPIKTYIYTRLVTDGTVTEILYNSVIKQGSYDQGNEEIPWDSCTQSSPTGHYHDKNPDFEFLEWNDGEYLPKIGTNSTNFDFFATEAIFEAKAQSTQFSSYLTSHHDAYIIDGYYNETQNPLWNLTFGDEGDDIGYYVVVELDGGSFNLLDESDIDIPDIKNSTDDFGSVLSISGSYLVFKTDPILSNGAGAFDPDGIKFHDGFRYGTKADIVYPTISLTISLAIERTEYGFILEDDDGSLLSAVDAINGQLIYTWEHTGDDVLSIIIGP
jgi:hypothetical protein